MEFILWETKGQTGEIIEEAADNLGENGGLGHMMVEVKSGLMQISWWMGYGV